MCPSPSGKPVDRMTVDGLGAAARRIADMLAHRDAGNRRWTCHDLRRTCASILGEHDTPEAVQKRILGHVGAGVTARVYDRSRRLWQMRDALAAVEAHVIERARRAADRDTGDGRISR